MSNSTLKSLAIFKDKSLGICHVAAAALKDSGGGEGGCHGCPGPTRRASSRWTKVGKRSWGKGAGIGAVVAPPGHPGLGFARRADRRRAAGGACTTRIWDSTEAHRDRIGRELEGGKAAVGVLAPVSESQLCGWQAHRTGRDPQKLILFLRRGSRGSPDGRHVLSQPQGVPTVTRPASPLPPWGGALPIAHVHLGEPKGKGDDLLHLSPRADFRPGRSPTEETEPWLLEMTLGAGGPDRDQRLVAVPDRAGPGAR